MPRGSPLPYTDTDLANTTLAGFEVNEEYLSIVEQAPDLGVTFADTSLGSQFERVAKIIATQQQFGVKCRRSFAPTVMTPTVTRVGCCRACTRSE